MAKFLGILQEKKQWLAGNGLALLAITILGLLPFIGFLTSSGQALYASDQLGSPAWKFYFDALRHGTIPWWNPYGLGGMPTFDAGFGDAAYPLHVLAGMLLPITTFVSWLFVGHVLIAGYTAYYLVNRFFGLDRLLSTALAVAYMFNTNFISHIHAGHTGKFYIMAWLPVSLYLLLRSLQKRAQLRHLLGLAFSLSLLLLTFHPQFIYFVLMGYFLVWAFKMFWLIKEKQTLPAALSVGKFWIPVITGIGLAFFLLYPPQQWTKAYGIRGSGEKTTYEHATSWSMHPEETAALIVPEFTGLNEKYWGRNPFKLNSEYPGLSVLFLGILGLVLFRKEREKWFWLWGGIGLLAVIFGLGAHTPFFRLFYNFIPGIKNFRAPSMMLFWLASALLVMSADVLSRLTNAKNPIPSAKRSAWSKRLLQVGLGLSGAMILSGLASGITFSVWDTVFGADGASNIANRASASSAFGLGAIRGGVLLALLVIATKKWLLEAPDTRRFGMALLAVTCVDLMWVNSNFIQVYDPARVMPQQAAVDFLKTDTTAFRVFGVPGTYDRSMMQYNQIETLDGWTDNEYRLYREFRGQDNQQNPNFMAGLKQGQDGSVSGSNFLDMLNVKYLAYRLQGDGAIHLAPNTSVLPRAWFVSAWESGADSQSLDKMRQTDFNPRSLVYISDSTPLPPGFAASGSSAPLAPIPAAQTTAAAIPADTNGLVADSAALTAAAGLTAPPTAVAMPAASITRVEKSYNRQVYQVENSNAGIAVFSELYFPHWHVTVDGQDAPQLRANYALRGVALSAGSHTVAMTYSSPWIKKGFAVAGGSFLFLLASALGLGLAGRKRENHGA